MSTLWVNGKQLVAEFKRLTGRRGTGITAVLCHLEFLPRADLLGASMTLDGSLSLGGSSRGMTYAGQLSTRGGAITFLRDPQGEWLTPQVELVTEFSHQQLTAIEDWRRETDLELYCDLKGLAILGTETHLVSGQLHHRVDSPTWTRLLSEMEFGKSITLTVPLEAPSLGARRRDAAARLEHALQLVAQGDYKRSVHECRLLLEALYVESDAEFKEYRPKGDVQKLKGASKEARFYLVREGIRQVANAASHDDAVARGIHWTRQDAMAVIGTLAALLLQES